MALRDGWPYDVWGQMNTQSESNRPAERSDRSIPEWVTFGVSAVVLTAVVTTLTVLAIRDDDPAAPTVGRIAEANEVDGQFLVPVEVVNRGDEAAASVQVTAELVIGSEVTTGDLSIDFLGGSETQELVFVFGDDPSEGELTVEVVGFSRP